jgi:hypothetical protein
VTCDHDIQMQSGQQTVNLPAGSGGLVVGSVRLGPMIHPSIVLRRLYERDRARVELVSSSTRLISSRPRASGSAPK